MSEIEGHEAWLSSYASPEPSPDTVSRVKEAVRLESDAAGLLTEVDGLVPSAQTLRQLKDRLRGELAVSRRRSTGNWWRSAALSAAACLALLAGLAWQVSTPKGTMASADSQGDLSEFVASLDVVLEQGDVQLALLRTDLEDLEGSVYAETTFAPQWTEDDLDDVREAIDSLGDGESLWLGELTGDDV